MSGWSVAACCRRFPPHPPLNLESTSRPAAGAVPHRGQLATGGCQIGGRGTDGAREIERQAGRQTSALCLLRRQPRGPNHLATVDPNRRPNRRTPGVNRAADLSSLEIESKLDGRFERRLRGAQTGLLGQLAYRRCDRLLATLDGPAGQIEKPRSVGGLDYQDFPLRPDSDPGATGCRPADRPPEKPDGMGKPIGEPPGQVQTESISPRHLSDVPARLTVPVATA